MESCQLVDLAKVDEGRRRNAWGKAASELFPGLSVEVTSTGPLRGSIDHIDFGMADLCAIESAPASVRYRPSSRGASSWQHISLMVQSHGTTVVRCSKGAMHLAEGDMCLVDERDWFGLDNDDYVGILFLRLPRAPALSRYPHLERLFGTVLAARESGTRLLSDTLLGLNEVAHDLGELQRAAMVGAVIQMLGVAEAFSALPESADWRVRRAVDYIELNISVAGLTAEDVARDQNISRRRLDQLMQAAHGRSIAGYLWSRRMDQAAVDLRNPHKADLSIAQIAFANGYEDAAHFTRAFRRRFGTTPGQWRLGLRARRASPD
ncbi:MAG: AraC family transcriptional regulator [Candidatus Andeanibacterium colombiense]|uniref:AraC family transcriptional regulator n=1 Tax=Candidatus Andeanibacterium colombiense TaxID=3121345 RepID=A0AAJ5X6N5_9SPHN|nr:MAG: AraC family transcriptional regulator [Sphingomonadaceae bacterium]